MTGREITEKRLQGHGGGAGGGKWDGRWRQTEERQRRYADACKLKSEE